MASSSCSHSSAFGARVFTCTPRIPQDCWAFVICTRTQLRSSLTLTRRQHQPSAVHLPLAVVLMRQC